MKRKSKVHTPLLAGVDLRTHPASQLVSKAVDARRRLAHGSVDESAPHAPRRPLHFPHLTRSHDEPRMLTRPPTTQTAEAAQGTDSGTDGSCARSAGLAKQHAQIASLRDINADLRDELAAQRDVAATNLGEPSAIAALRRDAAADRANAASDRQRAAADRRLASAAGLPSEEKRRHPSSSGAPRATAGKQQGISTTRSTTT